MATIALTGLIEEWFTPADQKDVEDPTRYRFKPLNGMQQMQVAPHGTYAGDGSFTPDHLGRTLTLRHALKGWDNLNDPTRGGQALAFNHDRVKFVPPNHLLELVNHILAVSARGAEDEKNSPSQ